MATPASMSASLLSSVSRFALRGAPCALTPRHSAQRPSRALRSSLKAAAAVPPNLQRCLNVALVASAQASKERRSGLVGGEVAQA